MPVIYYSYFSPVTASIAEAESQEHFLGRELLLHGLNHLHQISCNMHTLDTLISISPSGKPYLKNYPDVHFNISHCNGLVACVFSKYPVGIDAELPSHFEKFLIKKVLSSEEKYFFYKTAITDKLQTQLFFRFWTLKEAYVKKTGTGINIPLSSISFTFSNTSVTCSDAETKCWQQVLDSGHILSICHDWKESDTISLNRL